MQSYEWRLCSINTRFIIHFSIIIQNEKIEVLSFSFQFRAIKNYTETELNIKNSLVPVPPPRALNRNKLISRYKCVCSLLLEGWCCSGFRFFYRISFSFFLPRKIIATCFGISVWCLISIRMACVWLILWWISVELKLVK